MSSITSSDGTAISYDRIGDGPPVIGVLGAFNTRQWTRRQHGRHALRGRP